MTQFTDGQTVVNAAWLNSVDQAINGTPPTGTSYTTTGNITGGNITASGTGTVTAGTGGVVTPSVNGGQLAGLRNRIINGDMRIAQRGTSGTTAIQYSLDRWGTFTTGATLSWSQGGLNYVSSSAVLQNYLQLIGTAGNTLASFFQRIESVNCSDLAGNNVTVSAWVYQSLGSTQNVFLSAGYGNTPDGGAYTTFASPNASVPNATWTKVSWTIACPNTGGTPNNGVANGLSILLGINNLTSGIFAIANVQVELGTQATPFEKRPIGLELALCQRYCVALPTNTFYNRAYQSTAAGANIAVGAFFPVPLRAAPTVATAPTFTYLNCSGATLQVSSPNAVWYAAPVTSTGDTYLYNSNTPVYTAEL